MQRVDVGIDPYENFFTGWRFFVGRDSASECKWLYLPDGKYSIKILLPPLVVRQNAPLRCGNVGGGALDAPQEQLPRRATSAFKAARDYPLAKGVGIC